MIKVSTMPDTYMGWMLIHGKSYSVCAELFRNGRLNPKSVKVDHHLSTTLGDIVNKKWFVDRVSSVKNVDDLLVVVEEAVFEIGGSSNMESSQVESSPQIIMAEIDSIGWDRFVGISDDLRNLKIAVRDDMQRLHGVELSIPPDYPLTPPTIAVSVPFDIILDWSLRRDLVHLVDTVTVQINMHEAYFTVMADIDENTVVLEPSPPSFQLPFRRIALSRTCSVKVAINVNKPLEVCEDFSFMGPPEEVGSLRSSLAKNIHSWSTAITPRENIERVLGISLPSKTHSDSAQESFSSECSICYAYLLHADEGSSERGARDGHKASVPDQVCPNERCARLYHFSCLVDWLQSVPTNKSSFGTLFGNCPYCQGAISAKTFG